MAIMKTKICEICGASFVPDNDEDSCINCQINLSNRKPYYYTKEEPRMAINKNERRKKKNGRK